MRARRILASLVSALIAAVAGSVAAGDATAAATVPVTCTATAALPPVTYYGIDMVPTKRVPGTGRGLGVGTVRFARSPFGVAVTPRGSYVYDLTLTLDRLKAPTRGAYVAWAASEDLAEVIRLGTLNDDLTVSGRVAWNKFLVIVSLEPSATDVRDRWSGPIVMRGISRSGLMHTLAGHGPFENEPCLKYGFR